MDPATLTAIYAVLATLGLVATDTYYNANTMYLDTTVAEAVAEDGYTPYVIDGIFIAEVKKITKIPSLVAAPTIQSSKTKPVSAALAQAAGLESALGAIHSLMGIIPPKMVTSVIVEDETKRVQVVQNGPDGRVAEYVVADEMKLKLILTGYDPKSGYFDIEVKGHTEEDDFDHMIRDAAFAAVLKLDPYLATLYDLNYRAVNDKDLTPAKELIEDQLDKIPSVVGHSHRALTENLRGILALLERDQVVAREYFLKAQASNPRQPIGFLNCAFLDVHEDRFEEAIRNVEKVVYPTYWPMTSNPVLLSSAYVIKGVAETETEKFKAAEASFQKAAALNPQSSEVFVYWARMLRKSGRPAEAERKMFQARQNSEFFENYPEMALLYFWLTEEGTQPLDRRTSQAEAL